MELLLLSVISIFTVIGVVFTVKTLIYEDSYPEKIIIYTFNDEGNIEYTIRTLKKAFPMSAIEITDFGSNDDTIKIAKKLLSFE